MNSRIKNAALISDMIEASEHQGRTIRTAFDPWLAGMLVGEYADRSTETDEGFEYRGEDDAPWTIVLVKGSTQKGWW